MRVASIKQKFLLYYRNIAYWKNKIKFSHRLHFWQQKKKTIEKFLISVFVNKLRYEWKKTNIFINRFHFYFNGNIKTRGHNFPLVAKLPLIWNWNEWCFCWKNVKLFRSLNSVACITLQRYTYTLFSFSEVGTFIIYCSIYSVLSFRGVYIVVV